MDFDIKIETIEYDEVLGQKCLNEYDWSMKESEDGVGEIKEEDE